MDPYTHWQWSKGNSIENRYSFPQMWKNENLEIDFISCTKINSKFIIDILY